jgi:phosphoribosylaminoimidazole carboxylase
VAINNSTNAALLAARIIGTAIRATLEDIRAYVRKLEGEVLAKVDRLGRIGWEASDIMISPIRSGVALVKGPGLISSSPLL